ncbi:MAG: hypothetical protein F6K19_05100 [Cyanothece sp. SIO1E1]|nr:hypothetical protein [Cyanothece sp. SIO1E1]
MKTQNLAGMTNQPTKSLMVTGNGRSSIAWAIELKWSNDLVLSCIMTTAELSAITGLKGYQEIIRHNHPENLELWGEDDSDGKGIPACVVKGAEKRKIVLSGTAERGQLSGCEYVWADPEFQGRLSSGQEQLFKLLLLIQSNQLYTVLSLRQLADLLGIRSAIAIENRLENLKSMGAIAMYRQLHHIKNKLIQAQPESASA